MGLLSGVAAALALCASAIAANAADALGQNKCTEDVEVKADTFGADYKGNTTQLTNVVISQCDIRVQAKHASATGLNFDNTRWTFDGDVKIDVEKRGSLRSNQAVVDFRNNLISKATITGTPAEFEQQRAETDTMARGHAKEIVYDVEAGTVRLTNDAWLKYGTTEMTNSILVYNIRDEQVQGKSQPGNGDRVVLRIKPKPKTPDKSDSNASPNGGAVPQNPPSTSTPAKPKTP